MFSKLIPFSTKPPQPFIIRHIRSDCKKIWKIESANKCNRKEILSFVDKSVLKDDPLAKASIPGQRPSVFNQVVRDAFDQNLSVIAKRTCGDFEVIGACINNRSFKMSASRYLRLAKDIEDVKLRKLLEAMAFLEENSNINDKLGQDEIFQLSVLSVDEKFWGKGIGLELVKKSIEIARENNFKYAKMNCMNENTRKIAEDAKMTQIWSMPYKNLLCRDSNVPCKVPDPPHESAYVYYIDLEKHFEKDLKLVDKCE